MQTKMYNEENEQLIAWTKFYMIWAGLWTLPVTENHILKILFQKYSQLMKVACFVVWLLLFGEVIRMIIGEYDSSLIMANVGILVNALKMVLKLIIYVKHDIAGLFKDIIEKEREIWQSNSEAIKTMYKKNVRRCKLYVIAMAGITTVACASLEIIGSYELYHLIKSNEANNATVEPHVMFQTLLPFNKLEHIYCFYAVQVLMCFVGLSYNNVTHLIFTTLLIYAASQLQRLQIRLRTYVGPDLSLDASEEEIAETIAVLKSLIRDHQYIIGFVLHINDCTKYIIMLEFSLTSLNMASVSANIITVESSDIGWLLLFFVLLFIQIILIGWACDEIKIQSEAIGDAIYESRWYLLNKEAKQLTEIMIARAQIPLLMTIGPFGPMTTNSVLIVLKAAYSYVSIMKD